MLNHIVYPSNQKIFELIRQKKINELMLRGRIHVAYNFGILKYELINKLSPNKYKIISVNGSDMFICLTDKGISRDLYLYKEREKFSTEFMKSFIKEDDVIFEIGANIGYYVILETKIANKGKIIAFEPSPFNRNLLHRIEQY